LNITYTENNGFFRIGKQSRLICNQNSPFIGRILEIVMMREIAYNHANF